MSPETLKRSEDCRRDALEYLAQRPQLKFTVETVQTHLRRQGNDYTATEVRGALNFLTGLAMNVPPHGAMPLVQCEVSPFGSTSVYGITAHGTLHHERNS